MRLQGRPLRRALGAGVCGAGLVLAGVLGATDGSTMPPSDPPVSGSAAVQAGLADGSPVPSPHTDLADGTAPSPRAPGSQR